MQDPSFLAPKKEPDVKPKKVVKAKVTKDVTVVNSTEETKPEASIKAYASKKIKNEIDVVIKQIQKLSDKITQHNEILMEQRNKLEQLKTKKTHLEQLKESI